MAERRHGEKAPPTESTVTGADWSGDDISGQSHTRVLFVDLDLTEVENDGAAFTECTFRRARFNVSVHRNAAFVNCTFANCNFYDARFTGCKLVGSLFDRCTFDNFTVEGGNWSFVGLPGADLRNASIRGARLREADLTGVRCQGAVLRDADLSGASLHRADFTECDLRGSDLSALEPETVQLRGAIISIDQTITIAEALGLDVRAE
ncbi:MAG TPA: pentapeptide repeat-containing protein [Longimicrobium sp.]|nr:pentapeptide repeat-containing protein [Longimicrobium sp.]